MNRRKYLITAGGALTALIGGTAAAKATRADIFADSELTRGKGEAIAIEKTITRGSIEYLESTNEVREKGNTEPFNGWAQSECAEIGARVVVTAIQDQFEKSVEGIGSGVRYLVFGPVITVDHTVTRDRDGSITSEPNVKLEQLISRSPRTMTITVTLQGQEYTKDLPVGVGHTEASLL